MSIENMKGVKFVATWSHAKPISAPLEDIYWNFYSTHSLSPRCITPEGTPFPLAGSMRYRITISSSLRKRQFLIALTSAIREIL